MTKRDCVLEKSFPCGFICVLKYYAYACEVREMYTDRQRQRQSDRQTDRQRQRQSDRQTDRDRDRQTETETV